MNQTANNSHIERIAAASNQRGSYSERTPSSFVPPQRRVINPVSVGREKRSLSLSPLLWRTSFLMRRSFLFTAPSCGFTGTTSHYDFTPTNKKRFTCLHNIGGWGQDISGKSPPPFSLLKTIGLTFNFW